MMKDEFEAIVNLPVNDDDYEKIEKVYMYYPGIVDKRHIAKLWSDFGMRIIEDMLPRATRIEMIEQEIQKLTVKIEGAKNILKDL